MGNSPQLKAIVAANDDWGIGRAGKLLVRNPADMRRFVELTSGGTVVMGRKTLESLPGGRPLKNRRNVVLTRDPAWAVGGAQVVRSLDGLWETLANDPREAWVIGGASVYAWLLAWCDAVEVTRNHTLSEADAYFPDLDASPEWRVGEVVGSGVTEGGVAYDFVRYVRA